MSFAPGTRFGPFEIAELIGAGGMGEVYRARDPRLGRDVALKTLPDSWAGSSEFRERFEREGRFLAALNHPNVAVIHGLEQHEGRSALVLELIDGPTLGDWITSSRRPVDEVLPLARQVAAALEAAHARHIVHRDLKPANVRIARDGTVKVLDFGIARDAAPRNDDAVTMASLTGAGAVLGTPGYLAPEQATGAPADPRTDVWAFGALLFEMLARRPAFLRPTARETLAAVVTADVPWGALPSGVPSNLRALLEDCLAVDPARRPADGAALRARLEAAPTATSAAEEAPSLIVLPLENLGGDPENESFAAGLTEEVIGDLANVGALRVFSRATALRYQGERRDAALATRELGARYVLDGSVRRAGPNVRVSVQLVDATKDAPVWADKYAGTLEDVFAIQETISRSIASALSVTLAAGSARRFADRRRGKAIAYEVYLGIRSDLDSFAEDRLVRARRRLERALEEIGPDPYLYFGLGRVAWQYINAGYSQDPAHIADLESYIAKLEELDPGGSRTLALRALRAMVSGDIGAWYRALERAEAADPAEIEMRMWKSMLLSWVGRTDEARAIVNTIAEIDPYSEYVLFGRMLAFQMEGSLADARRCAESGLEDFPGHTTWPALVAQLRAMSGDREGARDVVEKLLPDEQAGGTTTLAHVFVAALFGDAANADRLLTPAFAGLMWNDLQYAHMLAQGLTALGRHDEALRWIERAIERGFLNARFLGEIDPLLAPLRGMPRFAAILERARSAREAFPGTRTV